jgi:hypothetical protein
VPENGQLFGMVSKQNLAKLVLRGGHPHLQIND